MIQLINKSTGKTFSVDFSGNQVIVNGKSYNFDLKEISKNKMHLLLNQDSHNAELLEIDSNEKLLKLKFKGETISFGIKDDLDLLLEKISIDKNVKNDKLIIKAPIPGLIVNVLCKKGEDIKKGDTILVLEAMKIENTIKSPYQGLVKELYIKKGDKVEKGQVMVEMGGGTLSNKQ